MTEPCTHKYCEMVMAYCLGLSDECPEEMAILLRCLKCVECSCKRWTASSNDAGDGADLSDSLQRGKSRLMQSLERSENRYSHILEPFSKFLDCNKDRSTVLLQQLLTNNAWQKTCYENVELLFLGGNFRNGYSLSFLRLEACASIPPHTHEGEEFFFVIEGRCIEENGEVLRMGKESVHHVGCEHAFSASEKTPLILALLSKGFTPFQARPSRP